MGDEFVLIVGIITAVINIVLIVNFVILCRDVHHIAGKIDSLEDAVTSAVTKENDPSVFSDQWGTITVDSQDDAAIKE